MAAINPREPKPVENSFIDQLPEESPEEMLTDLMIYASHSLGKIGGKSLSPGKEIAGQEIAGSAPAPEVTARITAKLGRLCSRVNEVADPRLRAEIVSSLEEASQNEELAPIHAQLTQAMLTLRNQQAFWQTESLSGARGGKPLAAGYSKKEIEDEQRASKEDHHQIVEIGGEEYRLNGKWGLDMHRNGYYNGEKLSTLYPDENTLVERFVERLVADGLTRQEIESLSYRGWQSLGATVMGQFTQQLEKEKVLPKNRGNDFMVNARTPRIDIITHDGLRVVKYQAEYQVRKMVNNEPQIISRRYGMAEIVDFNNQNLDLADTYVSVGPEMEKPGRR